ncbi:hypothetical protein LX36DRAFT_49645 [Colletotrichum falcatum]|nr:hypothetical protein LX36DRAFT_49645 [Colletotrichum falcatum]
MEREDRGWSPSSPTHPLCHTAHTHTPRFPTNGHKGDAAPTREREEGQKGLPSVPHHVCASRHLCSLRWRTS